MTGLEPTPQTTGRDMRQESASRQRMFYGALLTAIASEIAGRVRGSGALAQHYGDNCAKCCRRHRRAPLDLGTPVPSVRAPP